MRTNGHGSGVVVALTAALLFAACEQSGDSTNNQGADTGVAGTDELQGPPIISAVLPVVAVSGGFIYIEGENLATPAGKVEGVSVFVIGKDGADAAVEVTLDIESAKPVRLTCKVPADMHTRIVGQGTVRVRTPLGEVDFPSPIFAVEDTGFGGATLPGAGLIGTVYALQPNTPVLPDFADPCADPSVLNDATTRCPYTTILVPSLDIPVRSFDAGFPGLGEALVEWFAIEFKGYLTVPEAGSYTFESCSDDGSNLYLELDGAMTKVVDNDGTHGMACQSGTAELPAGRVPFVVDYFQGPKFQIGLQVYWTPPGTTDKAIVPAESFRLFDE